MFITPYRDFLSEWVSLFVGFAAPVALAAMAFHGYTHMYTGMNGTVVAVAIILIIALDTFVFHSTEQLVAKWYYCSQVILILLLIAAGFYISPI